MKPGPVAPPAYRPQSAQPQPKRFGTPGGAPPAYRPYTAATQAKPAEARYAPVPDRLKAPALPIAATPFRAGARAVLQRAQQPQYAEVRQQVAKSQYTPAEQKQILKERAEKDARLQLLKDLARPQVLTLPQKQIDIQKSIQDELERIPAVQNSFVAGLGAVLLPEELHDDTSRNITLSRFIDPPEPRAKLSVWCFSEIAKNKPLADLIVANTVRTMQQAGQIAYLRSSGLTKGNSAVIVEVHYYRNRDPNQTGMHKDTLGETLFVNLNYMNEEEISGPEYVFNPRPVETHEDLLDSHLPDRAYSDLNSVKAGLAKPTQVEWAGNVPRYGVVVFADEFIHHATPTTTHREVIGYDIKTYLQDKHPAAYANAEKQRFTTKAKPLRNRITKELWQMAQDTTGKKFTRPELRHAGMRDAKIDILLDQYIRTDSETGARVGWASVSIPGSKRAEILEPGPQGRPALPRTISSTHLYDQDPSKRPKTVVSDRKSPRPRQFFRTWVRAVRRRGRSF
jgi:hypothetical protein